MRNADEVDIDDIFDIEISDADECPVLRIQRSVLENASRYFKAGIKLRLSTFPPDRHRRVLFYPTAGFL